MYIDTTSIQSLNSYRTRTHKLLRKPLRIAVVAPLVESVPPKLYGGTERFVSWLIEMLVAMGHEVTLFASGDSETTAYLHASTPKNLRRMYAEMEESEKPEDYVAWQRQHTDSMLLEVYRQAKSGEFDVVHLNVDDPQVFQLFSDESLPCAVIMTMHGRLDQRQLHTAYHRAPLPLVSISDNQRELMTPDTNWAGTVYHGLPDDLYRLEKKKQGNYLLSVGRVTRDKGLVEAIKIAIQSGVPLKIAAKVDPTDRVYFSEVIKPLLEHPLVTFLGEIDDRAKQKELTGARALLFPIDWPEPFGLVQIEAMATGTPVIAYPCGSVPEVLDHGKTGFIISGNSREEKLAKAVQAVHDAKEMNPITIRRVFGERFTARRMAEGYVNIYRNLLQKQKKEVISYQKKVANVMGQ